MSAVRCLEVTEKHKWYTYFTIILKSLTTVNEMLSINQDKLGIWKSVDITSEKNINVRASIYHLSKKKDKKPQVAVVCQTAHKLNELICHPQLCQHSLGWWYQLSSALGGLRQSHEVAWRPQLMLESPWHSTEMLAWLNLFSCSCNYRASSSHQAFNMGLLHMVSISRVDRLSSWRVAAATAAKSLQSCLTLCNQIDGSPPGSRPWDSPGKNTGVGCHFLLQCMKVKSESEVAQSCPTLSNLMDCSLPGSSAHGIFQARVLEWGAIAFSHGRLGFPKARVLRKMKQKLSVLLTFKEWNWQNASDHCILLVISSYRLSLEISYHF